MKVVAVIPVKGRLPLIKYTIQRLYRKNGVYKVICIGDSFDEQLVCTYEGAEFIKHPNEPLGKKWNAGFAAAKKHEPDAVLFVGSSDWISDNWIEKLSPLMDSYDMVGKPDFNLLDIGETYRFCSWRGYGKGPRENEPIGIGRLISARILEKLKWQPIDPALNNSMDYSMYKRVLTVGGNVHLYRGKDIQSLSISTNRWPNKHKFEDHYSNKIISDRKPDFIEWLDREFPEYKLIFKDENQTVPRI